MSKTKTNINLIVNGTKVYTRKTTGRPYTHALVCREGDKASILSCSSNGTTALQRQIDERHKFVAIYTNEIANGPEAYATAHNCDMEHANYVLGCRQRYLDAVAATEWSILPIIDNTVTVTD